MPLAGYTSTPCTPLPRMAPHHDIAFEEEGWLQADAKLLGPRACDVTEEERTRLRLNRRHSESEAGLVVGGRRGQEGVGRLESEA